MRVRDDGEAPARSVLVVEDEPAVRAFAAHAVRGLGLHALEAPTGDRALELVRRNGDSLVAVLLDLLTPGRSASSTLAELRALRPELPVLLTSGHLEPDAREQAGGPVGGYLQKPYSSADLRAALAPFLALEDGA